MLRELYSKYSFGKRTPRSTKSDTLDTPSTFETPADLKAKATPVPSMASGSPTHLPMEELPAAADDAASIASKKKSNDPSDMSLNDYLNTYTSEDNQSFQDFMEEAQRKHRVKVKYHDFYSISTDIIFLNYFFSIRGYTTLRRNLHNFNLLPQWFPQLSNKLKSTRGLWTLRRGGTKPRITSCMSLMVRITFLIENLLWSLIPYFPGVPLSAAEEIEMAKKAAGVVFANTRFKKTPFKESSSSSSTQETPGTGKGLFKQTEGKIGVDGKEIESSTPKVNGFSYVRTPSPNPGGKLFRGT
jgi:protein DGCR14